MKKEKRNPMLHSDSQEQTIYRKLAERIQLGFYSDGERFPTVQDITKQFNVSYCPAQRALNRLSQDGFIKIGRGKETVVLGKPYENYLESDRFKGSRDALVDLCKSLRVFSPDIGFQGLLNMDSDILYPWDISTSNRLQQWKGLYGLFEQTLATLGNKTILSLYYDIGSFIGSSFLDILHMQEPEGSLLLQGLSEDYLDSLRHCEDGNYTVIKHRLENINDEFFDIMTHYLEAIPACETKASPISFSWTPHKGRTRYCDLVAIDLICKIRQGIYPVGTKLSKGPVLADFYHVSPITVRRAIGLLNKLGITKTTNGVGTHVISTGNEAVVHELEDSMRIDNLRTYLEALQMLTITCESIMRNTFPYLSEASLQDILHAAEFQETTKAISMTLSVSIRGIVNHCPLEMIREIYTKLTPLLLNGNTLQLDGVESRTVTDWPAASKAIAHAILQRDGGKFAFELRRLAENTFTAMKRYILQDGLESAAQIVTPDFHD